MKLNLSVRKKTALGLGGMLVLVLVLTLVGIFRVRQIDKGLTTINDINTVKQRYAINFRGSVHERAIRIRDLVLFTNKEEKNTVLAEITEYEIFYRNSAQSLDDMYVSLSTASAEEEQLLEAIKDSERKTLPILTTIISYDRVGGDEQAKSLLLAKAKPAFDQWLLNINAYIDYQEAKNISLTRTVRARAQNFQHLMIQLTAAAFIIALGIAFWIIKSVLPLQKISLALKDIAEGEGNLTVHIPVKSQDEIGRVAINFNAFVAAMHGIISTVKNSVLALTNTGKSLTESMAATQNVLARINTDIAQVQNQMNMQNTEVSEVSSTITEINANLLALNEIIEKQTASLDNSSSAVEQMIANIQSVTSTLTKSLDQFDHLSQVSKDGFARISDVEKQIIDISEKSRGMSEANAIINSIAAQTNLLAMNAAIEAAHAGDAGKGFAVVADEIRKLAENSASQSKTISATLKNLVYSIEAVVGSSRKAGESFEAVRTAIETVVNLQNEIQSAMDEQSSGNVQVRDAFSLIRNLNHEVRTGSGEMLKGSQNILEKVTQLVGITSEIFTSMQNMAQSTEDIGKTVGQVSQIGIETENGIHAVRAEMDRFIL